MRQRFYLLLVACAISLSVFVGWGVHAQRRGAAKVVWEYRSVVNVSDREVNALGAEGWEMVGFSIDAPGNRYFYFKRAR